VSESPSERDRYIERAAERAHDEYERRAGDFSYETRPESRKAWSDLPENHRALMRASIEAALSEVLDENARLREALERLLEADLPSHFDPRTITAWQEARTLARAALSPGGGAERPEEALHAALRSSRGEGT
jgi:hypothetical protein